MADTPLRSSAGSIAGTSAQLQTSASSNIWLVIFASSVGTMIEWYDFYLFAALVGTLSPKLYPPGNGKFQFLAYWATFAIGFVVRPFGALFFGRIGDLVGRKRAFLVTLTIMGVMTACIGLLPSFATAGWFSPIALIVIRILQGLALGGEYGGAAVYVAEHSPDNRRGFYTSFIQITATLGLFVSLAVVLIIQSSMTETQFKDFGWRIPFLISIVLVAISLYIRLRMKESPIYTEIKSAGMTSAAPLKEAFTKWPNLKQVLISLFGATAGQGVVWYTGQFYAQLFLRDVLRVDPRTTNIIVGVALLLGIPFFTVFGALSDKIGRKKIMMAGCLLAVLAYYPIYGAMQHAAGNNVTSIGWQKNATTGAIALTPKTTDASGNPANADKATNANVPLLVFLVFLQVVLVTMVYGPIAAYLVEAFPAKIRYTSLSLPYHIGNGVFGGMVPLIGGYVCASTGKIYSGLWYPMIIASITFVVGSILLKETGKNKIWTEVAEAKTIGR
jgi:MFS family permease